MKVKAEGIADILADYENNNMTTEHVLEWVRQFDIADQEFILDELLHIFRQTYVSKMRCRKLLTSYIKHWANEFKYDSIPSFISETIFLDLQPPHKSQRELLDLLDEILLESYGCSLTQSGQKVKRYVYLDDILSTGGTLYKNLNDWFNKMSDIDPTKTNFQLVDAKKIRINICLLCCHSWGLSNTEFRFMQSISPKIKGCIEWYWFFEVQNNLKNFDQSL